MSDFCSRIVLDTVDKTEAKKIANIVIQHLINEQIVSNNLTDCVLGQENGYPPGEMHEQVFDLPNKNISDLKTNGVEINLGRQVFHANSVDKISCPHCETNIIDLNWGQAISEWMNETSKDSMTCPNCDQTSSISKYDFEPTWAFGELGFTFWNWGTKFNNNFLNDIENITGHRLKIVYNRL